MNLDSIKCALASHSLFLWKVLVAFLFVTTLWKCHSESATKQEINDLSIRNKELEQQVAGLEVKNKNQQKMLLELGSSNQ